MTYDYKRYFDKVAVIRDLTTMPEKAAWRTTLRMPKMRSRPYPEFSQWRLDDPEVHSANTPV
jgi:hypothetical protein